MYVCRYVCMCQKQGLLFYYSTKSPMYVPASGWRVNQIPHRLLVKTTVTFYRKQSFAFFFFPSLGIWEYMKKFQVLNGLCFLLLCIRNVLSLLPLLCRWGPDNSCAAALTVLSPGHSMVLQPSATVCFQLTRLQRTAENIWIKFFKPSLSAYDLLGIGRALGSDAAAQWNREIEMVPQRGVFLPSGRRMFAGD